MKLLESLSSAVSKVGFSAKEHSPTLFIIGGIIGIGASMVLIHKAATKSQPILAEHNEKVEKIKAEDLAKLEEGETLELKVSSNGKLEKANMSQESKSELVMVYKDTAIKLVKTYAPAVALAAVSIAAIVFSHTILQKRNVAFASAYTAMHTSFKEYRQRVADKYGEEVEKDIRYNLKNETVEKEVEDPETGKKKKVKEKVKVYDGSPIGPYAKFFDECSIYWEKNSEINLHFLKAQEDFFNKKLIVDGYVFLNDVLDSLDIPKVKAGQVVGWRYDPANQNIDNRIDFGIMPVEDISRNKDFVNGRERSILLDFNVDGNIIYGNGNLRWEDM